MRANLRARTETNMSGVLSLISCNEIYLATPSGDATPGRKTHPKKFSRFFAGPLGGPCEKFIFLRKKRFLRKLQFPPGVMLKKGRLSFSYTEHARGPANIFPVGDRSHHHNPPTKLRRRARSGE